jgi:sugar O-acyltransferase (sialic acid O-acetyltransferase NeuD family)
VDAPRDIAVYSCGGFGREVAWLLSTHENAKNFNVVGYIEDDESLQNKTLNDKKVFSLSSIKKTNPNCLITVAIGDPKTRHLVVDKCIKNGFRFEAIQHGNVEISDHVSLGEGSILCAGSIITVNIEIGKHVQVNLDCTIGHDARLGDFTTLSPGVHVSGNVHIEDHVYLGTGATIINGTSTNPLVVSSGTIVGAGACLTRSTEPNSLYVGVPATRKR